MITTPARVGSIKGRLALTTMVTSALAVVLLTAAFLTHDLKSVSEALVRRLTTDAEIVGINSTTSLLFDDPRAAENTLTALTADPTVRGAAIYDSKGRLFATYQRDQGSPEALPPDAPPSLPAVTTEQDRLVVWRQITVENKVVGTVVIRADLSERAALLRSYLRIAIMVGLGVFAFAVILALRVQRTIIKPIDSLAETAAAISARKDYSMRAATAGVNELVPLVTTFNDMLDNIQHRDADLQEAALALKQTLAERTTLYRQAEEANRLKDQFLATLSHELRTPLNAIAGWVALLESGKLEADTTRRAITTISRNVKTQTKLIEDILDVSRIVSGKMSLNVRALDLPAVMQAAVDAVQHAAEAAKVRLQLVLDGQTGTVFGDPDRLQQVFCNILLNAIKFTPQGGRVYVRMWRPNSHVEIMVADTGVGIAREFLPHVFDRFRQGDASSTRSHGGLGLGLAIVKHVVDLHGGSIEVASDGEGKGTTVTIKLPLAPVSAVSAAGPDRAHEADATAATPAEIRLDGLTILVADDDADSRELLSMTLTDCGAEVRTASTARSALELFGEMRPDVVLSDIEMPGEDGYWLIEQIRARSPQAGGRVPAAALTAYARSEDRLLAIQRGFQIHLAKPVEAKELAAVIGSLAGRRAPAPDGQE